MTAINHWRTALGRWAIPDQILEQTRGQSPWQLDPQLFTAARPDASATPGLATTRALDALPMHGSVLDVGCGGGAAGLALVPPAGELIGVDESAGMLERFSTSAAERDIAFRTVLGRWPEVASETEQADVVVCHHVVYNVAGLDAFALALGAAARTRIVIELTSHHPGTRNREVWRHFWGIDRPTSPTSGDALEVLTEAGIDATLEHDTRINAQRAAPSPIAQATQVARMCCLGPDRLDEVMTFLAHHPPERQPPDIIWWDVP